MPAAPEPSHIPEGTKVTADDADLGEGDLGAPVVTGATSHSETGEPALAVTTRGLFKKRLVVPTDRLRRVEADQVTIGLSEDEASRLSAFGTSVLPPGADEGRDVLAGVVPAAEPAQHEPGAGGGPSPLTLHTVLRALGPGVVAGAADNDPTTVGTLAVIGSQTTYALSWLLLLVLPMMASIQAIASAVGVASGQHLQRLIRTRFSRMWTWLALTLLAGVNVVTLAADLEGGAAALGLLTHRDWRLFTLPLAVGVSGALFFGSYATVRRILTGVVFMFVLYIPAAFLAHPDWGAVVRGTLLPHLSLRRAELAGTLALLGTTLTSYVYYWQTIEESEQVGTRPPRLAMLDAGSGMVVATAIFWFILVTSGATLGAKHQEIQTAQDAAGALQPIAGPLAEYLFAAGLLASALLALPVLAGTTAYAVGDTLGWPVGLSRQPWRSQGFYLVLLGALLLVVPLTLLGIEPMTLLFVAGLIGGIGTPVLLVLLLRIAADRAVMHGRPISRPLAALGWGTTAVVSLATLAYLSSQFR